jgi:nucleotide-binding universal stress UspA family protein
MERKIIIGFEDTQQGRDALALGQVLSEVTAARPIVVTVYPWPHGLMARDDLERALGVESEASFAFVRDQLATLNPLTRAIAKRSVAEALSDAAEEEGASLTAIGSCHRGRVGRTLLGGTGVSLVHGAPCAVAVAPAGYASRGERSALRIAAAYDGSPEAWAALETAIGLAERVHGELTILTVAEPYAFGYATAWAILSPAEFHDFEREQKQRVLDLALGRVPPNLPSHAELRSGSAGAVLAEASADFDLLVAGSRGYGPLKRTMLGTATRELLDGAHCPVLILPRAAGVDPLDLRADRTSATVTGTAENS